MLTLVNSKIEQMSILSLTLKSGRSKLRVMAIKLHLAPMTTTFQRSLSVLLLIASHQELLREKIRYLCRKSKTLVSTLHRPATLRAHGTFQIL
jgi:siroheme synthase (precorrin-2 oxidase/ferrochelatase)